MAVEWTDKEKAVLVEMHADNSASQIATILKKSRNAVIGMAHRMQLPSKKKVRVEKAPPKKPEKRETQSEPCKLVIEIPVVAEPKPENAVPMLEATRSQCRAIIGSTDARNETVMVCGEPIPVSSHFSFCEYHLDRYIQPPYRRG